MIEVITPSGNQHYVINQLEEKFYNENSIKYLNDYKFTNASDLQDLDKILAGETLVYRWSTWLSTETDYDGSRIDLTEVRKAMIDQQKDIRDTKKSLGMDKLTRDKDKGQLTADYIEQLRHRAKEFGIMRNDQAAKAITLWQELDSIITLYKNCTEDERKSEHVTPVEIINWIESQMPEFREIDRLFQLDHQRYWIQEQ